MKSNEEMVRSVLERVKKARARQARIRTTVVSVAACFCLVTLTVLGAAELWLPAQETTEATKQNCKSRLSVFSVNAAEYRILIEDVDFPQGIIRVRDVSENTELEKVFIRREMLAEGKAFGEGSWIRHGTRGETEDTIVVLTFAERLMVVPEDIEQVADYSATATNQQITNCSINPNRDPDTGEIYRGIEIQWYPSAEFFDKLLENPKETKLSELKDTITVTVKFTDGSTESVVVDVNADDDGNIYMTKRGAK